MNHHPFLDRPSRLRPELSNRELLRDLGVGLSACLAIVALGMTSDDEPSPEPTDDTPSVTYLDMFSD